MKAAHLSMWWIGFESFLVVFCCLILTLGSKLNTLLPISTLRWVTVLMPEVEHFIFALFSSFPRVEKSKRVWEREREREETVCMVFSCLCFVRMHVFVIMLRMNKMWEVLVFSFGMWCLLTSCGGNGITGSALISCVGFVSKVCFSWPLLSWSNYIWCSMFS